jgi:hypothetical protein
MAHIETIVIYKLVTVHGVFLGFDIMTWSFLDVHTLEHAPVGARLTCL